MPRRRSSPMPMRTQSSPSRNLPARVPPTSVGAPQQPRQPGMFAQMATTAAGVAVGSAVGHTVGAALTGGLSNQENQSSNNVQPISPQNQSNYGYNQGFQQNPCQNNIDELLRCTLNETDIGMCRGFSEALNDCKRLYGLQ